MKFFQIGTRILAWSCLVISLAILAPGEKANAATVGYNVEGGLDLNCTFNVDTEVLGGCKFRAMFDLTDPVMDGATGNVPTNIMFELLDMSDSVLSSFIGPFFDAATVIVQANGDVTESDITDGFGTGYTLSADLWSWDLNGYFVPVNFAILNGVSVTAKQNSIPPIPLPAAAWLFLSAIGSLGLLKWRRRRSCAVPA